MKYSYQCNKCQKDYEFEMSVKEYEKFTAQCVECGSDLDRIYEVPQMKGVGSDESTMGGGDQDNSSEDFDTGGHSCSGTCSACPGCG